MNNETKKPTKIRLNSSNQPHKTSVGAKILKITSSIDALEFSKLFLDADIKVNPRNAKDGKVVESIKETLEDEPEFYFYKSKGILVSSKNCRILERNRVELSFNDTEKEGIMDGGHNSLAIAEFIVEKYLGEGIGSRWKWQDAKKYWFENYADIVAYIAQNPDEFYFSIPIEIVTTDNTEASEIEFNDSIADICNARNNNVQLRLEDKSHNRGNYDYLKDILTKEKGYDIQWKDGEGGKIKSKDVITLSTLPLLFLVNHGLLPKEVGNINPTNFYSGKNNCLSLYDKVVTLESVGKQVEGRLKITDQINSELVKSALRMTEDLLKYHDLLFINFPSLYTKSGGSYGSIRYISKIMDKKNGPRKSDKTPKFGTTDKITSTPVFDPYFLPLVYGTISLMKYDKKTHTLGWKKNPNDISDLKQLYLVGYRGLMEMAGFNPQTIGKTQAFYLEAENSVYRHIVK